MIAILMPTPILPEALIMKQIIIHTPVKAKYIRIRTHQSNLLICYV